MKRIGNLITFLVLSTALLLNGTSRDFIHSFAHHHDTVDRVDTHNYSDHHAAFEKEHHHCDFLHLTVPVYHPVEVGLFIRHFQQPSFNYAALIESDLSSEAERRPNRGPPVC